MIDEASFRITLQAADAESAVPLGNDEGVPARGIRHHAWHAPGLPPLGAAGMDEAYKATDACPTAPAPSRFLSEHVASATLLTSLPQSCVLVQGRCALDIC